MANIELLIKVDKAYYDRIKDMVNIVLGTGDTAIANGVVLPKGHGRIADADALIKRIKNLPKYPNGHSKVYDEAMIVNIIDDAPTIIEADKERCYND